MRNYLDLLHRCLLAPERKDRTGVGTYSLFGEQLKFDLSKGFPLVTTKKMYWPGIVHELLWFLKGDTNITYLNDNNVHIWDEWADKNGELGPVYGAQWRKWPGVHDTHIDQIKNLMRNLKNDPYSRRHVVSAWNVAQIPQMALAPCHCLFQFYVDDDQRLSCHLYQRSADIFLGVPFNIASYALLTMMIANQMKFRYGHLVISFGDVHLYKNHTEAALTQLRRTPLRLPTVDIRSGQENIFSYKFSHFTLDNYESWPAIKAEIAI